MTYIFSLSSKLTFLVFLLIQVLENSCLLLFDFDIYWAHMEIDVSIWSLRFSQYLRVFAFWIRCQKEAR